MFPSEQIKLPTTRYISYAATADFNHDGKLDVVAVERADGSLDQLHILLGNGDGTFNFLASYDAGVQSNKVIVADLNNDGNKDLLVGNDQGTVGVPLGGGNGTFGATTYVTVLSFPNIFVGDFNGDGKIDFYVNKSDVFLGAGNGTFTQGAHLGLYCDAAGDTNKDGRDDLFLSTVNGETVYLGKADGTFQVGQVIPATIQYGLNLVDMNGDGKLDVLADDRQVLLGTGTGTFGSPIQSSTVAHDGAVADFNGDGKLDLLTSVSSNPALAIGDGAGHLTFPTNPPKVVLGYYATTVPLFAGDFNNDGKMDAFYIQGSDTDCYVVLGNGDGTFKFPQTLTALKYSVTATTEADFNGDGRTDLAVAMTPSSPLTPEIDIYLAQVSGSYTLASTLSGYTAKWLAAGDFNGDGKTDLISTYSIFLGNGAGSFPTSKPSPVSGGAYFSVADFNSDGKADIAEQSSSTLYIELGAGNGTFTLASSYSVPAGTRTFAIADFDQDGIVDFVDRTGNLYLGKGDGTFKSPRRIPNNYDGNPRGMVCAGDFDGNGIPDCAFLNSFNQVMVVAQPLTSTSSSTHPSTSFNTNLSVNDFVAGDFNADGRDDIAAALAAGTNVSIPNDCLQVLSLNLTGNSLVSRNFPAGPNPYQLGIGDLNADGKLDLAVPDFSTSGTNLQLLSNQATIPVSFASITNGVMNLNQSTAGGAISIGESGTVVTIKGPTFSYNFSSWEFNSITVTGTSGNDSLTIATSLDKPFGFNGGSGNDSLNIASGAKVTLASDPSLTTTNLTVNVSGKLVFAAGAINSGFNSRNLAGLSIAAGGSTVLNTPSNHVDRTVLTVGSLSIAGTGKLDIGGNDLIIHNGNLASITASIAGGFNIGSGYWNGTGITSSSAATDTRFITAIGVISNDNGSGAPLYSTSPSAILGVFDNANTVATDVLIKFTYYGDADINGVVNGTDYSFTDGGFNNRLTGWLNGDFNYDGRVDGTDYSYIDGGFNNQASPLQAASAQADLATAASGQAATTSATNRTTAYTPPPADAFFSTALIRPIDEVGL